MYYEDIRTYREKINLNNRINNCEQANVEKSMASSNRQIKDIEISKEADNLIINIVGITSLRLEEIDNIDKIINYLENICNNYELKYKILINNNDILLESKVKA